MVDRLTYTKELNMNNLTPGERIALAGLVVAIVAAIPAWLVLRKPEEDRCTYAGRVLNYENNKGIDKAKVTFDYKTDSQFEYTNSEGNYKFVIPCVDKNFPTNVRIDADGYDVYNREVTLSQKIEPFSLKPKNSMDVNSSRQTPITAAPIPPSNSSPSPKPTQPTSVVSQPNLGGNLIKNPGFEEGFAGWEQNNAEHRLERGYKSSQAACSIQKALPSQRPQWVGVRQEKIEVKGDQKYRFQAWLSWENAVEVHLKVIFYDRSNNELYQSQIFNSRNEPNSGGWVIQGDSVAAPKNTASALIVIWHGVLNETNVANSKLCIDDVVFAPIVN